MNTKKCIYRNCGNVSSTSQKLTFFSFPLKDVAKCKLWSVKAGCENQNLKQQYLCENHFNTIYLSKTPRRTVLLPNAVPYRWDENVIGDDNDDDYHNTENSDATGREEIPFDPLTDDDKCVYIDEDQRHQSIEILDEDAIVDEDGHDDELNATKTVVAVRKPNANKIGEQVAVAKYMGKETIIVQQHRMSLPNSGGEFANHVTKRQRMNNHLLLDQQQRKVRLIDSKKLIRLDEKHALNNGNERLGDNNDHIISNANDAGDSAARGIVSGAVTTEQIDSTIQNPNVATFFLHGEEYIQMPKRIYLEQRAQFDADLARYRTVIDNMKNVLNAFE